MALVQVAPWTTRARFREWDGVDERDRELAPGDEFAGS